MSHIHFRIVFLGQKTSKIVSQNTNTHQSNKLIYFQVDLFIKHLYILLLPEDTTEGRTDVTAVSEYMFFCRDRESQCGSRYVKIDSDIAECYKANEMERCC